MVIQPDYAAELDALKKAHLIASSLTQFLDCSIPSTSSTSGQSFRQPPSIPTLTLSFPPDIITPITELNITPHIRDVILQRIDRLFNDLQEQVRSVYRRACVTSARTSSFDGDLSVVHDAFQAIFKRNYIPKAKNWVSSIVEEIKKHLDSVSQDAKRRFNNQYTPVLVKYFELNGYPSVAHRNILAKESNMTARQIEVWFQNHRKRAKEEGKFVRRLDSDLPLKRALGVQTTHVNLRPIGTASNYQGPGDGEILRSEIQKVKQPSAMSVLDNESRPPHAFPTKRSQNYPDPFPNVNSNNRFPPPVWSRRPATAPIIPIAVDMNDFTSQFHMKLNFVNMHYKWESTTSTLDLPSFTPWFAPSRTIPNSAPLPALQQPRPSETSMLSSTITMDPLTFVFPKPGDPTHPKQSNVACIVRLPFGPHQSASSITERIDRSVDALDRERKGFRMRRCTLNSPRSSISRLSSNSGIAGRKGSPTSRRGPSGLQPFGSRTSSFTSDTSSSSDDSSSPSTPPSVPNHSLHSDPVVESDDFATNFGNFFEVPSSPSFDFTFSKPPTDTQPSSPQLFDLTFTNSMNINTESLSSRTFDFTFSKPVADRRPSALLQTHTPLIFT